MPEIDITTKLKKVSVITPTAGAGMTGAGKVGSIVDTAGFDSLDYSIQSGVVVFGDFEVLLEQGDIANLSDATTVPAVLTINNPVGPTGPFFDNDNDNEVQSVGDVGKQRFHRLTITSAGATAEADFSVLATLTGGKNPTE